MTEGSVYFLERYEERVPAKRLIKIGYSGNPEVRVYCLQADFVQPLRLLRTIPGTMETEKGLHRLFSQERVEGEWFNPAPGILEIIQTGNLPLLPPKPLPILKQRDRVIFDMPRQGGRELWKAARMKALESEQSISEWLFEAIREKLTRPAAAERRKP